MAAVLPIKDAYKRFFDATPGKLHFAAHSHHPWMDVTRDAQLQAWDDATRFTDHKWEHVFERVLPSARQSIASRLGLSNPSSVALAPNTHEFVMRLLSCFEPGKPLRVLTTDSEFYSFDRQIARYAELPNVEIMRVSTEHWQDFELRFAAEAKSGRYDLVFFSHVFFNSGLVVRDLAAITRAAGPDAVIAIDGYHAFSAIPVNLGAIEDRVFYLAGGYKYAQAGEGACFMHVPQGCKLRPIYTGWFATFLSHGSQVAYPDDGNRFAGSTYDPTGWYRFNATNAELERRGVTVEALHAHVRKLQTYALDQFEEAGLSGFSRKDLVVPDLDRIGHFLTFKNARAGDLVKKLAAGGVTVDSRGDRFRIGLGAYHAAADIDALTAKIKALG